MYKLLATFKNRPDAKTAKAIVRWINKHPMATCFATIEDMDLITRASVLVANMEG